jgi:GH15 family glucan-1,4-alpha-glucosidase
VTSLELGIIGNCAFNALIDQEGVVTWCCLPRPDGDPVFNRLINQVTAKEPPEAGFFAIALQGHVRSEQAYLRNTAVLVTRLYDDKGGGIEITDFAPRFQHLGRTFRPTAIVRMVRPIAGAPRIEIRLRPTNAYGREAPQITHGSNHIRYVSTGLTIRLSTNAPLTYVLNETPFHLQEQIALFLGPDETFSSNIPSTARDFLERTIDYWRGFVHQLALPLEWQDVVIRAAITLKMCSFEETGAIIAAMTTSIPEAANSGRNWDYRFCWLRDAFFVLRALNSLSTIQTMEDFLSYISNVISASEEGHLQPVYGIGLEAHLIERMSDDLAGYRGMGPVRIGNQAYEHFQHDVYGDIILAASQAFFDERLYRQPGIADFEALEAVGERACAKFDQPDAGMWELRTRAAVHTTSSIMCWAACDRLAKIAAHIKKRAPEERRAPLEERARHWRRRADDMHEVIIRNAWNEDLNAFTSTFQGDRMDAGLLLMPIIGFIRAKDPRFLGTLDAVEKVLRRGKHLFRYADADDFGEPEMAFNVCTFWYIEVLHAVGRREEAREIFENMLACRNRLGLLSEDTDTKTNELWGNFPQTYSMVGLIHSAMLLSRPWEDEI